MLGILKQALGPGRFGTPFGNGPVTTTISRSEIEKELANRGYVKGAYQEISVPKYSTSQAITMGVDAALQRMGLATTAPTRQTLDPEKWTTIADVALASAQAAVKQVSTSRQLVGIGERGF